MANMRAEQDGDRGAGGVGVRGVEYRNSAARPRPAPSTIPVARSRPRGRCTPIMSITPAASTPIPAKPHSGLTPARKEAEPPVTLMSASACPANDWPRSTVNDADDAGHHGDHAAREQRRPDRGAGEEARLEEQRCSRCGTAIRRSRGSTGSGDGRGQAVPAAPATTRIRPCTRITSTCWPYSALSTSVRTTSSVVPAGGPARGQVDDAVHHRQQRVHVVRRDQHRDLLLPGDPGEQRRRPPARCAMSRLASGSSSSSSRGRLIRAWAISTRCCSPPDRRPTRASANALRVDGRAASRRPAPAAGARGQRECRAGGRPGPAPPGPGRAAACRDRAAIFCGT